MHESKAPDQAVEQESKASEYDAEWKIYEPSERVLAQIRRTFKHHPPEGNQAARYGHLRDQARTLAHSIVTLTPESREQVIALTKLEEAVMFAIAAIARHD